MKRKKPRTDVFDEERLKDALAILISNTRTTSRSHSLIEVAKWLDTAVTILGDYSSVSARLGVSAKMLRQFSKVEHLSPPVKRMFALRQLDSVDAAAHLAMLPKTDQVEVAKHLAEGKLDTRDVRAIVELARRSNACSIHTLIKKVEESKTKKEYIVEFIVRGSRNRNQVFGKFSEHIPRSEIVSVDLEGAYGRLTVTQRGKQILINIAKEMHIPLKDIVPKILYR